MSAASPVRRLLCDLYTKLYIFSLDSSDCIFFFICSIKDSLPILRLPIKNCGGSSASVLSIFANSFFPPLNIGLGIGSHMVKRFLAFLRVNRWDFSNSMSICNERRSKENNRCCSFLPRPGEHAR